MHPRSHSLLRILNRLRRRMLAIGVASAIGWGVVAAAAWLFAAAWLDLLVELSPELRLAAMFSSAVVALGVLAWLARRSAAQGTVPRLAGRLDSLASTRGQIRSAAELERNVDLARARRTAPARAATLPPPSPLTRGLAELAVRRGAQLAGTVPGKRVAPLAPMATAAAAICGGAALFIAVALLLPRLAETQWLRLFDPFGDHPPYSAVTFTVAPGDAEVIYGQGFDVRVTADKPLSADVELVLVPRDAPTDDGDGKPTDAAGLAARDSSATPSEQVLPMFPEPGGGWRATVANVTRPATYFVRSHRARSHRHTVGVILVPRFEGVRFRVTPPTYTYQKSWEGELPKGGLAGLPGTLVEIRARSNRPLRGGTLEVVAQGSSTTAALRGDPADPAAVVGSFEITGNGRIELRLEDESGRLSTETFRAPVLLLEDERPFIRLIAPPAVSFATPSVTLPVVISAEDDYGISRLQLFRGLNDSRYLPLDVAVSDPPPLRTYETVRLPLAAYGLKPGDEIKLFARVEDNDPAARPPGESESWRGGKGAESSVVLVRIISDEDFQRMRAQRDAMELLQSKYRQAQRRMESVADEFETLRKRSEDAPDDQPVAQQARDELQRLVRRLEEETEAFRRLSEAGLELELDRLLEQELDRQSEQLQRLRKRTDELARNQNLSNEEMKRAIQEMLDALAEGREQLDDEVMEPLAFLESVRRLARDENRFVELYERQRELAERLSALRGRDQEDDPALKARMRDLESEQARIRDDLARLLADIEEHAAQLPEGDELDEVRQSALDFVAEVRKSGASEAMVDAETGLAEFDGTRGHAGAKQAADILERFLSKCSGFGQDGAAQACRRRFAPGMAQSLRITLGQLLQGAGAGLGGGGGGGGYSARRSTLQNVGLFGNDPLIDQQSAQRAGLQSDFSPRGAGDPASIRVTGRPAGAGYDAAAATGSADGGESLVPLRYRRKVGRYFQRIADEVGND